MSQNVEHHIGQRRSYDGALCTVRYIGQVGGTSGEWLGVEWDDPSRGKHDGSHKGARYFTCLSKSPTAASFVRPTRPVEKPQSFLEALQQKYASEVTADHKPIAPGPQIVISGKVAEEIGFDKIRRQQAQLSELKIVILDGMRIVAPSVAAASGGQETKPVREICPKVTELDLSRNLLADLAPVVEICSDLTELRGLRLNGNRFLDVLQDESLVGSEKAFKRVKELAVDETLMRWDEICHVATRFLSLAALYASSNQLSRLSPIPASSTLLETLTSIYLEFNDFTSLSDIASLAAVTGLRNLHLKGNRISAISSDTTENLPAFSKSLTHLDISYNKIHKWSFIDALPDTFPGLVSLRLAHNPVYDNPGESAKATVTEEAYMLTVGRLGSLKSLNFSTITPEDRTNAEMFYLSRIGRQLSSVPDTPEDEARVIEGHRRYHELCELYGEPAVNRRTETNPNFLEARLVSVVFRFQHEEKRAQVPKSLDIYAVKGVAGRLFGHPPLKLRLIWETGEWDPVAGYDEEVGDSSDDEEESVQEQVKTKEEEEKEKKKEIGVEEQTRPMNRAARWVKREVELNDSPRQFGFCVDGLDVTIRVEPR
ncbi:hypothetical protein M406DRAFT_95917 [Cryphonectria parasitica EP155]|uniref:CAP-Gly domain-containing protein n=1 Tax=Cryphonectria parasitica (strain ATCC 38755 / EP155) TaxID=660469 RepID=A0A9P4YA17_CRYP1|nr:uncharacterized protein M406DRAFT_95917 [Cryphonectria parasitica EP155]KAF3769241.1 hypothetical protein M406DRAFT_95917 [Cryphonectria parasitica EP155]